MRSVGKLALKIVVIVILFSLTLLSCKIDPEQYIPVHIVNNTSEELFCHNATLFYFTYTLPKKSSFTIMGIKGIGITITGKDSRINYGTKTFYSEGTWIID